MSAGEDLRCRVCGAVLGPPTFFAPDRNLGTGGEHGVAVCARCGAGLTLPPVDDAELAAFYPAGYGAYDDNMPGAARLASRAIRSLQGKAALRSPPVDVLQGRPPGRGLDVGCGRGDLAVVLAGRGWTMSGVEPSAEATAVAVSRGINARCGTLSTVSLERDAYDAIVFRHSLEHINDPVAAMRTASSALVPDGMMLVSVPNFGSWQAARFRGCWYHLDLPRHRVHFTPRALELVLEAAGLDVVSMSTTSSTVGLPASVQYRLFGRCLFPTGLGLRIASGLCALVLPLNVALDRARGGGDTLHAVARRADRARSISSSSASTGAG